MSLPVSFFAAVLAATCAGGAANAAAIRHVYAFGDSYADNGAALRVSRQALAAGVPSAAVLPAAPAAALYWEGRWSNGPTAVENLAAILGAGLTDYAVGGAKSGDGNYYAWLDYFSDTGLLGQVRAYTESLHGKTADPGALYVIGASANDYFQLGDFRRTETPQVLARRAAANTARAVELLAAAGARSVMVSASYLLGAAPAVAADPDAVASARAFAAAYDGAARAALARISGRGRVRVVWFEWGKTLQEIADGGARWGLTDVRAPCQPTLPTPLPACASPDAYMWWDEYHPSRRTHQLVAEAMARALGPVRPGAGR